MTFLLAHHVELRHVPVLLLLFAAGTYIGWHLLGRCLTWRAKADGQRQPPG